MKPIKLTIEGINSFIEPQTLDFEAVGRSNLFCISGKTGAGKTTIFDSIMLALYGKSTKGNLADVVNLSLMSARVELEFAENGEIYKVERTIKCRFEKDESGAKTDKRAAVSDCLLYKNGAPFAKGEEANAILSGIIGLEAAEFKNVYLLEQGEYAEFLKKTPSKQTEAVGKIFSLMRFGDVYKRASEKEREQLHLAEIKSAEIARLGDVSPQKLKEEKDVLKALRTKTTALVHDAEVKTAELAETEKIRDAFIRVREKQDAVKKLMLQSDDAKKREYEAKTALEQFEKSLNPEDATKQTALRDELNKLSALNALDREYSQSAVELKNKKSALDTKRAERTAAEQRLKALEQTAAQDKDKLAKLIGEFAATAKGVQNKSAELTAVIISVEDNASIADIVEAKQRLIAELNKYNELCNTKNKITAAIADLTDRRTKQLAAIEKYEAMLAEIAKKQQAAEAEVEKRANALTAAQLGSHAAAVRAELHDGDVCPVCGGRYDGSHDVGDTDVEKRKSELETAKAELKRIEAERADTVKLSDRAKSDYENHDNSIKQQQHELEDTEKKIVETCVLPEVYDRLTACLDGCKAAAEAASKSNDLLIKHNPELARLEAECKALESALAELESKTENYLKQLGESCGKTDGEIARIKSELSELEKKLGEVEQNRKKLSGELQAATAAVAAIENSLSAAKADCPVDSPEFDEDAYTEKRDALDRLKKQIAENEKDIAVKQVEIDMLSQKCDELAALNKELSAIKKQADLYKTIADLTKSKAMLNFVAAEYITEFTAIASDILNDLSGGKYTMRYDKTNGFMVSDFLNGGKYRKTDTLSGGELFLASLSVAIAIASTQGGGNNAFFFLDEGFGTLDEDLIDVVYGALESLGKERLVGVITHAEALISRMPYCVTVVEATDTCGSRIIV